MIDWNALDWADTRDDHYVARSPVQAPPRMLATLDLGGVSFHVEAVRVIDVDGFQSATSPLGEEQLEHLYNLSGGDKYQTTTIHGFPYVVFLVPMSQ